MTLRGEQLERGQTKASAPETPVGVLFSYTSSFLLPPLPTGRGDTAESVHLYIHLAYMKHHHCQGVWGISFPRWSKRM